MIVDSMLLLYLESLVLEEKKVNDLCNDVMLLVVLVIVENMVLDY